MAKLFGSVRDTENQAFKRPHLPNIGFKQKELNGQKGNPYLSTLNMTKTKVVLIHFDFSFMKII